MIYYSIDITTCKEKVKSLFCGINELRFGMSLLVIQFVVVFYRRLQTEAVMKLNNFPTTTSTLTSLIERVCFLHSLSWLDRMCDIVFPPSPYRVNVV